MAYFVPDSTHFEINKVHGRIEKRTVSICQKPLADREWSVLQTLICVESERQLTKGGLTVVIREVRYYIASFNATASEESPPHSGILGSGKESALCSRCDPR